MTTPDETRRPPVEPGRFTARSPEDLIAFVPVALGFRPEESVTMLTFGGPRPFHARLDLPAEVDEVDDVVRTLLPPVREHQVEQVVFVLFADDTGVADELAWALADAFTAAGIGLIDVLRVHGDRWFPVLPGHPPEHYAGVPLPPGPHPFAVRSVVEGRVTLGSREELRDSLRPDPGGVARVVAAAAGPEAPGRLSRVGAVASFVRRHVADGIRCDDVGVAALAAAIADPARRDEAWSVLQRSEAAAHVELWRDVVRRCPDELVAAPAAVLALSAWLSGNGALAWCAVDRCREVEPGHSLAGLVAEILQSATAPSVWDEVRGALGGGDRREGAA